MTADELDAIRQRADARLREVEAQRDALRAALTEWVASQARLNAAMQRARAVLHDTETPT